MMNPHTLKRMKTEALLTRLADRDAREAWEKRGAQDTHARAMQRVHEILAQESHSGFSTETEAHIRRQYKDLVSGELEVLKKV